MKKKFLISSVFLLTGCQNKLSNKNPEIEIINSDPKYKIQKNIIQKTSTTIKDKINSFVSIDQYGKAVNLKDLLVKGPVLVIGLLHGCPCNEKAQPIINNLASKYKNNVTFIGLMPGKEKYLSKYAQKTKCTHLVVLDKESSMISTLKMRSSGFITLIGQNKEIIKSWPGYSIDILKEINQKLSNITKQKFIPFDSQYAPSEITCGCPYAKFP